MVNSFGTKEARICNKQLIVLSTTGIGKTGQIHEKKGKEGRKETGLHSYTIYKIKLKVDKRLKCKA